MRKIPENPPSLEEWKALYDAADSFFAQGSWAWMADSDLFAVGDPHSDEIGHCCIMGSLGEHLALAVYPGASGLYAFELIASGALENAPPAQIIGMQNLLMASFESLQLITPQDRNIMKRLGRKYRGTWPLFRSYRPGYEPWYLTRDEARFLTTCLEQAVLVAERARENSDFLIPDDEDMMFIRVPEQTQAGLTWRDEAYDPIIAPPPFVEPVIDNTLLERVAATARRSMAVWEIGYFYLVPQGFGDKGERPELPLTALAVDAQTGTVMDVQMLTRSLLGEDFPAAVLELMERGKELPARIKVLDDETEYLLQPIAAKLGIELEVSNDMEAFAEAASGLVNHFMRGL